MKHLKRVLPVLFVLIVSLARAEEGMWLPLLLEKLNAKQMKSLGMKISPKEIYDINTGSLKDAIVSFGGFCTGEVISSQGLVLTNHHCGFGSIQDHSTLEHNYIRDGFWAKNRGEEIPNAGLFVTFIIRMEDATKKVLDGVTETMTESERQSAIDRNTEALKKNMKRETWQDVLIRPFFEGNQYYLFITETYRDVRLVGAPPSSIGNFGKDTDNWMWPRHTGDFSLFRIYAGKDNRPAPYSADNIPYTPKRALAVSLDGVKQDDFTMVFGFPGRTMEYLPSFAVEQILKVNDPAKVAIRDQALSVIDGFMRRDEKIKIQYASKYAGISNSWKKWKGEMLGLIRTDGAGKKKMLEETFRARVENNPQWKERYGSLLHEMENAYKELGPLGYARDYYNEVAGRIEFFSIASQLNSLVTAYDKEGEKGYRQRLKTVKEFFPDFFKDYNTAVDKKLFETLMTMYVKNQEKRFVSPHLQERLNGAEGNFSLLAEKIFGETDITDADKINGRLEQPVTDVINYLKTNPALRLYNDLLKTYQSETQAKLNEVQARINRLQRKYMQAQMDVFGEKTFYPDANSTLRVTYGKVKGYQARDAVRFDYYSYLDGVMEKFIPGDYEFDVPPRLKELYEKKDYGSYGQDGKMPVCFIAANHTTGGNSGSPALDAYGNLVGLNFDRVWEGTMSDINYDPAICRNIMVDIRYVLFIIDKFAGASHLVQEMKLVSQKKKKEQALTRPKL